MTLAGTRPPTVDEWEKYELHHRARLAAKPGLTGMWQVSGRSKIDEKCGLKIYNLGTGKAEMTFVLEANRLPLYASEEMIQFIEKIKNPQIAKETKMEEFLIILRRDLCENTFENFSDIKGISLVLPNDAEGV